jgi:hypothetical protein
MTSESVLGVGTDLQSAMSKQPHERDWQDSLNTLSTMNDVYHDMSEAHRDQSSALYKTSAFERQRVAEKINRSVPDSAVMNGRERYNGKVQVGFIGPSAGEDSAIGYISGDGQTWTE